MNKSLAWTALIISLVALGVSIFMLVSGMQDSTEETITNTAQNTTLQNTSAANETSEIVAEETVPTTSVATSDFCSTELGFGFDYPTSLGAPTISPGTEFESETIKWGDASATVANEDTGTVSLMIAVNSTRPFGIEGYSSTRSDTVATSVLTGTLGIFSFESGSDSVYINVKDGTNSYLIVGQYNGPITESQLASMYDMLESWTNTCVE